MFMRSFCGVMLEPVNVIELSLTFVFQFIWAGCSFVFIKDRFLVLLFFWFVEKKYDVWLCILYMYQTSNFFFFVFFWGVKSPHNACYKSIHLRWQVYCWAFFLSHGLRQGRYGYHHPSSRPYRSVSKQKDY